MRANITTMQAAALYISKGWSVVPIPAASKGPKGEFLLNWNDPARSFTEQDCAPFPNLGMRLGTISKNLADVDIDRREAREAAEEVIPLTRMISGHQSNPRSHAFFQTAGPLASLKFKDPFCKHDREHETLIELRANDEKGWPLQTVVPPSTHRDTSEPIVWYGPLERLPQIVLTREEAALPSYRLGIPPVIRWMNGESPRRGMLF